MRNNSEEPDWKDDGSTYVDRVTGVQIFFFSSPSSSLLLSPDTIVAEA